MFELVEVANAVMPMPEKARGQVVIAARRTHPGLFDGGRLWLMMLSAVVSFACFEVGLRLFWHNPYRYEVAERALRLRLNNARTDRFVDRSAIDPARPTVRFRTDERSYLLPSRRFATPDATVAFLGGSTTECMVVQEDLRFPARVSYLLEKKGLKVNTLNAGKAGNTTHDAINVLLNHIVEDKPDVVVLMEATNDIGVLRNQSYRERMGEEDFSHVMRFGQKKASSTLYSMGLFRQWATSGERPDVNPWYREEREKAQIPGEEFEKRLRAFV